MIAIDTNILIRFLVEDDIQQTRKDENHVKKVSCKRF
jgi:predicted nucleic-acid-binding protein